MLVCFSWSRPVNWLPTVCASLNQKFRLLINYGWTLKDCNLILWFSSDLPKRKRCFHNRNKHMHWRLIYDSFGQREANTFLSLSAFLGNELSLQPFLFCCQEGGGGRNASCAVNGDFFLKLSEFRATSKECWSCLLILSHSWICQTTKNCLRITGRFSSGNLLVFEWEITVPPDLKGVLPFYLLSQGP